MQNLPKMAAVLFLLILLSGFISCANVPDVSEASGFLSDVATDDKSGSDDNSLTFLIEAPTIEYFRSIIDAVDQKLGTHTILEERGEGVEGDTLIKARLASGDMCDIFRVTTGALFFNLYPENNMLDLSDQSFCAKLSNEFKQIASVNGKIYAVPTSSSTSAAVWLYNKEIYRDFGLSPPNTWDEFMSNCEIIGRTEISPIIGAFKVDWHAQLILLADEYNVEAGMRDFPALYTANRVKYATTPSALRSFEKMADAGRYMNSDYLATTDKDAMDMLLSGRGAHLITRMGSWNRITPEAAEKIGIFDQPGDDPDNHGVTVWMPSGMCVYKNSAKAELAKRWLSCYMENYSGDQFSASKEALPLDAPPEAKQLQAYYDEGRTVLAMEFTSPLKGADCIQICLDATSGLLDPASAAAAYDKDMEKQAVSLGLPGW